MKRIKYLTLLLVFVSVNLIIGSCKKNSTDSSACYVPTTANVTTNATLLELQQGRVLYMANCNKCHGLYSPDSYGASQWKSILNSMAPKTSMSSAQVLLVTKYVCKGQQ